VVESISCGRKNLLLKESAIVLGIAVDGVGREEKCRKKGKESFLVVLNLGYFYAMGLCRLLDKDDPQRFV
jgi:hypothetical protein